MEPSKIALPFEPTWSDRWSVELGPAPNGAHAVVFADEQLDSIPEPLARRTLLGAVGCLVIAGRREGVWALHVKLPAEQVRVLESAEVIRQAHTTFDARTWWTWRVLVHGHHAGTCAWTGDPDAVYALLVGAQVALAAGKLVPTRGPEGGRLTTT